MEEVIQRDGNLEVLEYVLRNELFSHNINPLIERIGNNISQLDPTLRDLLSEHELTPKTIVSLDSVLSLQHFDIQKRGIEKRQENFEKFRKEFNANGLTPYAKLLLEKVGSAVKQLTLEEAKRLHEQYDNELSGDIRALLRNNGFAVLFSEDRIPIAQRISTEVSNLVDGKGNLPLLRELLAASMTKEEEKIFISRFRKILAGGDEQSPDVRPRSPKSDVEIVAGLGLLPSKEGSTVVSSKDKTTQLQGSPTMGK